jgi:hypothetical protein
LLWRSWSCYVVGSNIALQWWHMQPLWRGVSSRCARVVFVTLSQWWLVVGLRRFVLSNQSCYRC